MVDVIIDLSLNEISYSRQQTLALGLLLLGEEVFALLDVRFDGVTSWFPASWADWKDKPVMSSGSADETVKTSQYDAYIT